MGRIDKKQAGKRTLLMGNEALARGVIEGGAQLITAYPGTPSSEIVETLIEASPSYEYYVEWSINEKVAFDMAAGASIVGARTLTSMKNAGLNVAMDTLMTLNYGGIRGGMVIIVCDDPSAHYSSNEQDSRFAAVAAEVPCFEPSNQQEAKDMVRDAFSLSERLELPVIVRSVSRISHGNGDVVFGEEQKNPLPQGFNKHWKMPWRWNVYGPPGAVLKHKWLHERLQEAEAFSHETKYNQLESKEGKSKLGLITSGLASSYVREALEGLSLDLPVLYLGLSYPLPKEKVAKLFQDVEEVFVVEEGGSFVVENKVRNQAQLLGITKTIYGKENNSLLNPYGEINTSIVKGALSKILGLEDKDALTPERRELKEEVESIVAPRSSTLCAGCPHLGTYSGLKKVLKKIKGDSIINVDIGCYEQAGYGFFSQDIDVTSEPSKGYKTNSSYEILDTCYVMGSSLAMAQGQDKVEYDNGKIFAVVGDSTFFHSILSPVVNAIYNNSDVTFLVLDNYWTAMTGHQPNPASGLSSTGDSTKRMDIKKIVEAMGAPFVEEANAFNIKEVEEVIERAINHKGFSTVVIKGECRLQYVRHAAKGTLTTYKVDEETCIGCKRCIDVGCPALGFNFSNKHAFINEDLCNGCELCGQVCPVGAITSGGASNGNN